MYMEATGVRPRSKTYLVSQLLPQNDEAKCLEGSYNVYGSTVGRVAILDEKLNIVWESIPRDDCEY